MVSRIERGWAGHFICADRCKFRRNTLIEVRDWRVVVSTVGNMRTRPDGELEIVGIGRHYETMAFLARRDGEYWDMEVTRPFRFSSNWKLSITPENEFSIDNLANEMHETVVAEVEAKLERQALTFKREI